MDTKDIAINTLNALVETYIADIKSLKVQNAELLESLDSMLMAFDIPNAGYQEVVNKAKGVINNATKGIKRVKL